MTTHVNKARPSSNVAAQGLAALRKSAADMGLDIGEEAYRIIARWFEFYYRWPGRRVVGFTDPRDVAVKLVADSFAVAAVMPDAPPGEALDLGSGNGWPGLAVRLFAPDRRVSLLDSRLGACDFMRGFLQYSSLEGVTIIEARAEEGLKDPTLSGRFSLVTTRAMAPPALSLELAPGFLTLGGALVLWLGPEQEHVVDSRSSVPEVGVVLARKHSYVLPGGMGKRLLAVYRRTSRAMPGYPRRLSIIRAKPLL